MIFLSFGATFSGSDCRPHLGTKYSMARPPKELCGKGHGARAEDRDMPRAPSDQLIDLIYDAAGDPRLWDRVLAEPSTRCGCILMLKTASIGSLRCSEAYGRAAT